MNLPIPVLMMLLLLIEFIALWMVLTSYSQAADGQDGGAAIILKCMLLKWQYRRLEIRD